MPPALLFDLHTLCYYSYCMLNVLECCIMVSLWLYMFVVTGRARLKGELFLKLLVSCFSFCYSGFFLVQQILQEELARFVGGSHQWSAGCVNETHIIPNFLPIGKPLWSDVFFHL